jgi:dihydropteroate synthase
MTLRLGRHEFADDATLMMAIVNRTPDSFYDKGATWAEDKAFDRVALVVEQGAEIVDIGGIKAAPGVEIDEAEEKSRVVDFVSRVRAAYPSLVISVDTWRASVADAVREAGADVVNDAWGGADPELVDAAARHGAAIVCTHTGGVTPRTRPYRIEYDDVVRAAIDDTVAYAERAVAAGVARESVVIDPAHDFGKNTFHSLELTRRLGELVATGWPVLVSLSNKDFVGETLDLPVGDRLTGTLAATAISALAGARGSRDQEGRRLGERDRRPAPAASRDSGAGMRVVIVPSTLALLPKYASIDDPIPELRRAVDHCDLGRPVVVVDSP